MAVVAARESAEGPDFRRPAYPPRDSTTYHSFAATDASCRSLPRHPERWRDIDLI